MSPSDALLSDEARLPVLVRSSVGPTFLLFLLILGVFIPPFLGPRNGWMWGLAVASLGAGVFLFLRENRKYFATGERLICRAFLRDEQIVWREVEAIATRELRSKNGPIGTTFNIYGPACVLRPLFVPSETGAFSRMLADRCPQALWIDEDRGTFSLPESGHEGTIRERVARHARRLRRYHGLRAVIAAGVLAPLGVVVYLDRVELPEDLVAIGVGMLLVTALSWTHWAALWRLRR